jgi:hypothetical protein
LLPLREQPINRDNLILLGQALFKGSTSYIVKNPVDPLIWTALKVSVPGKPMKIASADKLSWNDRVPF